MKLLRSLTAMAITILLQAGVAFAASEGHHGEHSIPWKELGYAAINFFVLLLILIYVLRKPAKEFFASRSQLIGQNIQESQSLRQEAQKKLQEYELKLKNIDSEMQTLVQQLEKEGELERQKIVDLTEKQIASMKTTQTQIIAQEVRKAKEELKRQAIDLSEDLAKGLIQKNFGPDDQKRIVNQYLEKMEHLS